MEKKIKPIKVSEDSPKEEIVSKPDLENTHKR